LPVLPGHQATVYVDPEERNGHHRQYSVTDPRQVYYDKDRIIGAGTSFTALTLTVPLDKPLNAKDKISTFTGAALLGYIGTHLVTQGAGDGREHGYAHHPLQPNDVRRNPASPLHFTYGLPHMDVGMVIAVPAPRGKKVPFLSIRRLPMAHPSGAPLGDIGRVAGRSPSAHPERLYLRASTASWDGQLVASVYVSVALQGHYLRVVIRPYVLAPIAADLKVADELVERHTFWHVGVAALWTVRQFVTGAKMLNSLARKPSESRRAKPAMQGMRSTRERYAQRFTDNVHQTEDSDRLIRVMELKIVRVTMAFLRDCNMDIEEYEKQITTYVQHNTVIGSGNITTGGTFNNSPVTNVTGDGNATPGATGPGAGGTNA
jgi:hypothetical protein